VKDRLGNPDVVIWTRAATASTDGTIGARQARRRDSRRRARRMEPATSARRRVQIRRELRAMYEAAGVTPDKEVVTYCQGGYRAAHAYLALRLLGYPRVRNYTGSWKEWGDREDLPIEIR
jgi:thiosulfate/3-mercaptopyruvate sulfurtransferase